MADNKPTQVDRIMRYADMIQKQTGKAVRPYREDGYVNLMNRYGTEKDPSTHYEYQREPDVPDDVLTMIYESNGLFSKIIDTPAEEAVKHGFTLKDVSDQNVIDFYEEALDELNWEETAMQAIRWARLFGGSIAVMLINDGGNLEDPLNWNNIQSIDDIRVYERAVVQPDYSSMFNYDPQDPFRTRGSRLGMPEYYQVFSKYGNFTVHDSRCLVFQNGVLPENATNSIYQIWGIPEYIRLKRALQDAELAHTSAPKLLDRSVQAIYKMKDLSMLLATEEGESQVLKRLQAVDLARGMMNSMIIDAEGEDYDFKTFTFSGINDVISASCNMLSAITSIPQTILFGQGVGGLSTTDDTSMENYYNYVERIQKRMLRSNLRYLLSVIFQAGLATGEVDEIPKLKVEFNPLWSMTENEKVALDQQKAQVQLTRAQTAQAYIDMEVIDPSEVRTKLADSDEFDVETMLDELDEDEIAEMPEPRQTEETGVADTGKDVDGSVDGSPTPPSAPAATKLPQDMSAGEQAQAANAAVERTIKEPVKASQSDSEDSNIPTTPADTKTGVGVLVVKQGKILCGTRHTSSYGLLCGPGGHIHEGEEPEKAAYRETEEEFGISPKELIPIGRGPAEPEGGDAPYLFLCTDFYGQPDCVDGEMSNPQFLTLEELQNRSAELYQPFADSLSILSAEINTPKDSGDTYPTSTIHNWLNKTYYSNLPSTIQKMIQVDTESNISEKNLTKYAKTHIIKVRNETNDGGPGSGNHSHEGVPGQRGGSAPNFKQQVTNFKRSGDTLDVTKATTIRFGMYGSVTMKAGTLTEVKDFAGVPGKKPVQVEEHLLAQYGGEAGTWKHTSGIGKIQKSNGTELTAEIHWFECPDVGQAGWKVKKYVTRGNEE